MTTMRTNSQTTISILDRCPSWSVYTWSGDGDGMGACVEASAALPWAETASLPWFGLRQPLKIYLDQEMQEDPCQMFSISSGKWPQSAHSLHGLVIPSPWSFVATFMVIEIRMVDGFGLGSLYAYRNIISWLTARTHQCPESVTGSSIINGCPWVGGASGSCSW